MISPTNDSNSTIRKTWRPIAAGIFNILLGVVNIILGLFVAFLVTVLSAMFGGRAIAGIAGLPLVILGIVAVIGGIFSIIRKSWWTALAGAICGIIFPVIIFILLVVRYSVSALVNDMPLLVMGILSLIFLTNSRVEFDRKKT